MPESTDVPEDSTELPPNGHPYADPSEFSIAGYESGDYRVRVSRTDGESLIVSFKPEQLGALEQLIRDKRDEHEGNS